VLKKVTFLYTVLIIIISTIPIPQLPFPKFELFQFDKFLHLIVYLIMSVMWLILGFLEIKKIKWSYLALVFFIGLITEICQGILPIGRYFEIADIIANSLGILIGFSISSLYILKNKQL
jgi:VanZ family protein|tara:strand:- start:5868 stop:6224 length:357 start_codon:yes stop_codon:yes gene_type:complete